ncbi:Ig-like domain-containing protein [Jiangella asiatica]|uniref:Uncharacterized protein n=1 Tax=Jiangella asiatica TaxID=2530372 RepID=A0A4R5CN41_9ACTN|nr:Ig-like domain-containing protein [Jiangella asiatica]TDE01822.1 hypothetical protein E1269_22720 [Jiangella asiatica]
MSRGLSAVLVLLAAAAAVGFYLTAGQNPEPPPGPGAVEPVEVLTAEAPAAPVPEPLTQPPAASDAPASSDAVDGAPGEQRPSAAPTAAPAPAATPGEPAGTPSSPAQPPAPRTSQLYLTAPGLTDPGTTEMFTATWVDAEGYGLDGVVELQRAEGATWVPVAELTTEVGRASTSVTVAASAVYRLAFRGSDELDPQVSAEVAVIAETRLESAVTVTATPQSVPAGDAVDVAVTWRNADDVPIIGDLQVQELRDGSWVTVTTVTTGSDGVAATAVTPPATREYRAVYPGGTRYLPVTSDPVTVTAIAAATIPVSRCATQADVDALLPGVGCHYTSVSAGVFVVGHDYHGNAWWNELPMGAYVELTGEQAGLYEVVDRVIAPGRAGELGPASQWTCGERCDVILQTCVGDNTGFTWLRRLDAAAA